MNDSSPAAGGDPEAAPSPRTTSARLAIADLRLARAVTDEEIAACLAIRREVFVVGQGVPAAIEGDGLDGEAIHYGAWRGGRPVATARVRIVAMGVTGEAGCDSGANGAEEPGAPKPQRVAEGSSVPKGSGVAEGWSVAKVQRVAVLAPWRGAGIGAALMRFLHRDLARAPEASGVARLTLGSQEAAMPFYARLGYVPRGAPFIEAGIPHRTMERPLGRARFAGTG